MKQGKFAGCQMFGAASGMREQHERERVDDTLFLEQAGDPSLDTGATTRAGVNLL